MITECNQPYQPFVDEKHLQNVNAQPDQTFEDDEYSNIQEISESLDLNWIANSYHSPKWPSITETKSSDYWLVNRPQNPAKLRETNG